MGCSATFQFLLSFFMRSIAVRKPTTPTLTGHNMTEQKSNVDNVFLGRDSLYAGPACLNRGPAQRQWLEDGDGAKLRCGLSGAAMMDRRR
jgi:hypothetical protein